MTTPPPDTAHGFAPSWFVPAPSATPAPTPGHAPERLWHYFMAARLFVGLALVALQSLALAQGTGRLWLLGLCGLYLLATAAALRWAQPAPSDTAWSTRWLLTLWVDIGLYALLQLGHGQAAINYTPLFVMPVLLAATLGPLPLALGSASAATLVLLFEAWGSARGVDQWAAQYVQGAITGAGLFLVALLAHELALRLSREQAQARLSRLLVDTQTQVNGLIATGLNEGVLVVHANGQVWHANPAACLVLGLPAQAALTPMQATQTPAWPLLAAWTQACLRLGQDEDRSFTLPTAQGDSRRVVARARLTHPPGGDPAQAACVVFLEDQHDVETRVRNEKLAAMGRVSAAVAHEIRNPLAAIAQANALLDEDIQHPGQKRLTTMIGHNVQRLNRTVDDILEVVRQPSRLDTPDNTTLCPWDDTVAQILGDWQLQRPQGARLDWQANAAGWAVAFEPDHLRRVLVNLLDNADRHASGAARAIRVHTQANTNNPRGVALTVWSDGPALDERVQAHLFEPFVSSQSRSSGLGLYISKELCERHGATLGYQRSRHGPDTGNAFTLHCPAQPTSAAP